MTLSFIDCFPLKKYRNKKILPLYMNENDELVVSFSVSRIDTSFFIEEPSFKQF